MGSRTAVIADSSRGLEARSGRGPIACFAGVLVFGSTLLASGQPVGGDRPTVDEIDPVAALASAADVPARRQVASAFVRSLIENSDATLPRDWLVEQPAQALRLMLETADSQQQIEGLAAALRRTLRDQSAGAAGALEVGGVSADARLASLDLLARSLEPASCELLVDWLAVAPPRERGSVSQALVRMTGRDDLGASEVDWREWLNSHRHLPPLAWRALLLDGVRDRAVALERRQRDLLLRLGESARRMHSALAVEQRSAYLVSLLTDAEPLLRSVGTDLVLRELERGVSPSPEVAAAVVGLLDDASPSLRQAAALLVDRIVPEGSSARLTMALRRETEPEVAAVMLRAFRRSPDSAAIDAVLRWREFGSPTAEDTLRAIVSLLDAGFEPTPAQRDRILATIDIEAPSMLSAAAVPVLDRLAGDEGRSAVVDLLRSDRGNLRRAAARVLEPYPWAVETLVGASESDTALLQRAADAIARHGPSAARLGRIALLESRVPPAPGAESLPITRTLARFTALGDRLAAAQELSGQSELVRAILGDPERDDFEPGPVGDAAYARSRALRGLPVVTLSEDVPSADVDGANAKLAQPATGEETPEQAEGDQAGGPEADPAVETRPSEPDPGG
ncbi:MAG: hypothetical protein HRU13_09860 [Phycisphaerales bacterium]|nr:hypothetical protein [Phycisphaerales bacterium]